MEASLARAARQDPPGRRDVDALPKAHLHLHFTGSLDVATLRRLAADRGERLPEQITDGVALAVPATTRGWFRFQRAYDAARHAVRSEAALRTVVRQAGVHDAAEGARRLELQIDPTSYAPFAGGLDSALEIVLDEARLTSQATGVQIAIVVAASRTRHAMEARTLARLAARYVGDGPGEVVGFGLSNDEWAGDTPEWEGAFRIARKAGLRCVPHGGELRGPDHVRQVVDHLGPARLGHGVRTTEDPRLLDELVGRGITFEVCPASNVHLGVYPTIADVPLPALLAAGATVALGADDPLLFRARLADQYRLVRDAHGLSDADIAALAGASLRASFAPEADKHAWLAEVDAWLAAPAPA